MPANPFIDKCSGGQGRPPLREKEDPAFRPLCGRIRSALQKHYGKWRAVIVDVVAKYLDCGMVASGTFHVGGFLPENPAG